VSVIGPEPNSGTQNCIINRPDPTSFRRPFDLAEGAKTAADAALIETGAWALFKDDPDSGGKLKVVYTSDELPRDLVVAFGPAGGTLNIDKAKQVMKDMSGSDAGQKILRSIQVESFTDIDTGRLTTAEKLFHAQ